MNKSAVLSFCVGLAMAASVRGATWHVATNGVDNSDPGRGLSWDLPLATISNAAARANTNADSTVLISNGTYYVTNHVSISNGCVCRGFSGNPADVMIDGSGMARGFLLTNATLAAVTVTNGAPSAASFYGYGGGVYCVGDAWVSNCIISGNRGRFGGGVYLGPNSGVADCRVVGNTAPGAARAGGVYMGFGGQLLRSLVHANYCEGEGGGLYLGGTTFISDCTVSENLTTNKDGGGILDKAAMGVIANCRIINNTSAPPTGISGYGGGAYLSGYSVYSNCVFSGNSATNLNSYGGGVFQTGAVISNRFINCLFYGNQAILGGGACVFAGTSSWANCTFVKNQTVTLLNAGAGIYFYSRDTVKGPVVNCIFYGNLASSGSNYFIGASASLSFANCCAMPVLDGGLNGNIAADPDFREPDADDYRLAAASPCINTGTNQDWMAAAVDLDGRQRLDRFSRRVDIGAYEYVPRGAMFSFH